MISDQPTTNQNRGGSVGVDSPKLHRDLLGWYDAHRRDLPWRAAPGGTSDPYHVWLSEIMLQQTTVATVRSYFEQFIARWPDIDRLADATLDEVLHQWQGLGYYARARNLHRCAQAIATQYGGRFPKEEMALLTLPGIGTYTASAIAAIAFDARTLPIDGNIERVTIRLFALDQPLPAVKKRVRQLARQLTPNRRNGDFAQALMDLGATVCVPRQPRCGSCPLQPHCAAHRLGMASQLPIKLSKPERPRKFGVVFWLENRRGEVLLRRRPETGLLGGLMELPSTDWEHSMPSDDNALKAAPEPAQWFFTPTTVHHIFTHFSLTLRLAMGKLSDDLDLPARGGDIWVAPHDLHRHALPNLMKKVCRLALADRDQLGR